MIQDLLQLSRIDAETDRLDMEIIDLTALLTFVLDRFDMYLSSEETSGKEYTIERDLPKESIWIMGDEDRMTQVLDNIMNNAIKYSIDGGNIRVTMEKLGSEVKISVADEGIGISPKDLQRIFSRFYRVDKARSREMGGSGLGLAISKEVIEQHNGHIWARSKEDEGTTFIITLPCEDIDSLGEDEWLDG
jgi:two-component system sensor histidine kinase VicK